MIPIPQQAIFRMVLDNSTIPEFERANVCTYSYFGLDYHYLTFLLNRYAEHGYVNLGEMIAQFNNLPQLDLDGVSKDVDFLIYRLKEAYIFKEINQMISNGQNKFADDGIQLLGFFEERLAQLREIIPTVNAYDIFSHIKDRRREYEEAVNNPKVFQQGFRKLINLSGAGPRAVNLHHS